MYSLSQRIGTRPRLVVVAATFMAATLLPSATGLALAAPAQPTPTPPQIERRVPALKPSRALVPADHSRERIHLKLQEGAAIRLRGSTLATVGSDDARGLQEVLQRHPGVRIERLFTRAEQELAQEKARIEAKSGRQQADKNLYYRLVLPAGSDTEAVLDELNKLDIVEIAYAEPLPAPPPVTTSDFVGSEGYLDASSQGGIDADFARAQPGGDGRRVKIIDVEYSWNTQHEDLAKLRRTGAVIKNRTPQDPFSSNNHGTAVVGELVGDSNGFGITGIVPGADLAVVNASNAEDGIDIADAVDLAHAAATAGDVIIIEQQTAGPNPGCSSTTQMGCVAVEWVQATYDAIVAATSDGIIVVEPAGNGTQNLDNSEFGDPFPKGRVDSGAIIVGAGAAPGCTSPTRGRLNFSNYGKRVDVQGWGECVFTSGYGAYQGGTDPNVWYTNSFSGTSSATPIVAGAAAALSSAAQELTGTTLTPRRVRSILRSTGVAQDTTTSGALSGNIGPLPNIRAALNSIRDEVRFELGGVPSGHFVYAVDDTTGRRTLLQRDWDGIHRGVELVDLNSLASISYHYEVTVGVEPVRTIRTVDEFTRTILVGDRDAGFVSVFNTVSASATSFNAPSVAYLNQRQTWSAGFTDSFGGIATPRLELSALGGTKAFSIGSMSYDLPTNRVCLFNTDGTSNCAAKSAGGTLQNQYVRVDVAATTATVSGKTLNVTWAFTLLDAAGNQRFSAQSALVDLVGLQAFRSDSLGVTHQPRTLSVSPSSGFAVVAAPTTLVGIFSDADGASDLNSVSVALTDGVTLSYSASLNRLYVSDEPISLSSGCQPGDQTKSSIRTASVSLNCAASTVRQPDANTLQVNWQVAFLGSLSGKRFTEVLQARDVFSGDSGPVTAGSLAIDSPPQLSGLTPTSGSQSALTAQAFTATFTDADGVSELDTLELGLDNPLKSFTGAPTDLALRYYANSNKLALVLDDGKGISTCTPGEARVISNSLASVDCAASRVNVRRFLNQPADMQVTWTVIPSRAMAGVTYQTLLRAADDVGSQTSFQSFGTWRVNS